MASNIFWTAEKKYINKIYGCRVLPVIAILFFFWEKFVVVVVVVVVSFVFRFVFFYFTLFSRLLYLFGQRVEPPCQPDMLIHCRSDVRSFPFGLASVCVHVRPAQ